MKKKIVKEFLQDYKEKTDKLYGELLAQKMEAAKEEVRELIENFNEIAREGKRMRGALVKLGYELAGGKVDERILRVSVGVEMFHAGLLVQDDVMDRDEMRRGVKSLHVRYDDTHYGEAMATLMGDMAFAWAWEEMMESRFAEERVVRAGRELARYFSRVVMGQVMDVSNARKDKVSEEEIMTVVRMKTAEYSGEMPLVIGAILARGSEKQIENLRKYGRALGMVFQLRDDWLSIFGSEIGKRVGNDLSEKKMTFLVSHFMKTANEEQRKIFSKVWGEKEISGQELNEVREVMREVGSEEYVGKKAEEWGKNAKGEIEKLSEKEEMRKLLGGLVEYVMRREI